MGKGFYASAIFAAAVILLSVCGPFMTSRGYGEQHPELSDMPPRVPLLERLGVMDGRKVLRNRRADSLEDTSVFPEGSVKAVVRTFETAGVAMADVEVDYYAMKGAPSEYFWFGTDYLGRDLWARVWTGARLSLAVALAAALVNTLTGMIIGVVSGYYGGTADLVLMRFVEVAEQLPQLAVFTLIILFFGSGAWQIVLALGIKGWTGTARILRAQFYRIKASEYVLAAKAMGASDWRVVTRHILPNTAGQVVTKAVSLIPAAIFSEAFLAYLGLGIQAPTPSLGVLLADGQKTLLQSPYQALFPAVLVSSLIFAFNTLSVAVRDRMDPKSSYM